MPKINTAIAFCNTCNPTLTSPPLLPHAALRTAITTALQRIRLLVVRQFIDGATFSLNALPAENAGTLVAGIVIGSLVLGLRPSRSERSRRSNDPNPTSVTFSPFATASVTTSKKALMIPSAY